MKAFQAQSLCRCCYLCRWEGRPKSPPLSWSDAGSEAEPSPTAWLEELDLVAEGLAALQEASEQHEAAAESGLNRVREVLLQHAGEARLLSQVLPLLLDGSCSWGMTEGQYVGFAS
jgi:hypothetical protein